MSKKKIITVVMAFLIVIAYLLSTYALIEPVRIAQYIDEDINLSVPDTMMKERENVIGVITVHDYAINEVLISSLHPKIASIEGTGVVTLEPPYNKGEFYIIGNEYGLATITALVDGKKYSVEIRVIPPVEPKPNE